MNMKKGAICETCRGDGRETCNNPDHGFIEGMGGEISRLGCPVCGYDENHKVKYKGEYGECEDCNGSGVVQNIIFNEDCLITLGRLETGSIDLLLQDTPFGITQNDWDRVPDFNRLWPEWLRVCKEDAAMVFFATQPFASQLIQSMPKLFRYDIIWHKPEPTGFLNANRMPLRGHESILVFYRKLPTYNPQKTQGHARKQAKSESKAKCKVTTNYGQHGAKSYDSTERFPTSVLSFQTDKQLGSKHPTQKPVELIRWLIRTYSNAGDLVFDGYIGSGTTAAAAILEQRDYIGSEQKKEYFDIAIDRISEVKQQRLF